MQALHWYWSRLTRMSPAEIGYRAFKAADSFVARSGMRPSDAVPAPVFTADLPPFIRSSARLDSAAYVQAAQRIMVGRHTVFDLEDAYLGVPPEWNTDPLTARRAPLTYARALDYRDERIVGNIKYLWEPNRHLHLVTLAQAYALTKDMQYAEEVRRQIESWIAQCPYERGPNWSSSLELGIRLINWSLTWQLLGGRSSPLFAGESGQAFMHAWLKSIYLHARSTVRHLSRFSSANNHLIGEAAGVWIASATWPYWPQMAHWGKKCRDILREQIVEQTFADGANREQAISYQQFVLDFFLLSGLAARAAGNDFDAGYWTLVRRMILFLASMLDAGGNMPMIGDADDGYVVRLSQEPDFSAYHSLIATGGMMSGREDLMNKAGRLDEKTLWLVGWKDGAGPEWHITDEQFEGERAFRESGYYVLGSDFEAADEVRLVVDAGPLGYLSIAAHGHADALAIWLSAGGREVLVDPGTYAYHTQPEWRRYFRGTSAHNTVTVDSQDQSEQCGNFMWSKHAKVRCREFLSSMSFIGEHDGYRRLSDPVTHRREISYDEATCTFTITDTLLCQGAHTVERRWHFAEGLRPVESEGGFAVQAGRFTVTLIPEEGTQAARIVEGGSAEEGGWISRSFGRKQPICTLIWKDSIAGETTLRTLIRCRT